MASHRFVFTKQYQASPISFWVHQQLDAEIWDQATQFEPPLPKPIPGRGYVHCIVEHEDNELHFASRQELEHVIAVLSQKLLPTNTQLSRKRLTTHGPNSHWLSRFPVKSKSWASRQRILKKLTSALDDHP